LNTKNIIHPYSDNFKAKAKVYILEEIMVEKLRSLFQRTRPRDLYDVWFLWDSVDRTKILDVFPEKFEFKNVKPDVKEFKGRKDDFKNAWERSLAHQLKELPEFEDVVSFIFEEVKNVFKKNQG